jgi:TonB family protein
VVPGSTRRAFAKQYIAGLLGGCALARTEDPASKDPKPSKADDDPVYEPGGNVTRPKLVHSVEPAFSTKSNEAFVEGTVTVSAVVTKRGVLTDMQVVKGLSAAQDRSALDALKEWRFEPGTKDGKPVNVRVKIQVDFHLL